MTGVRTQYLSLPHTLQDMTQGQMTRIIVGKRRSDMSRGSSPVWLCWSSAHLVQCGPVGPSWTWTQTWVEARMSGKQDSEVLCYTRESVMLLAHPKVAQLKPVASLPQVCHWALTVRHRCQTVRWKASSGSTEADQVPSLLRTRLLIVC